MIRLWPGGECHPVLAPGCQTLFCTYRSDSPFVICRDTQGAVPCGVAIALDRMERGSGELSAVQEVERLYSMPVVSIASLDDLAGFLQSDPALSAHLEPVNRYREQYGVTARA